MYDFFPINLELKYVFEKLELDSLSVYFKNNANELIDYYFLYGFSYFNVIEKKIKDYKLNLFLKSDDFFLVRFVLFFFLLRDLCLKLIYVLNFFFKHKLIKYFKYCYLKYLISSFFRYNYFITFKLIYLERSWDYYG